MHRFTLSQRGDLVKIHLVAEECGQIPLGHSICYGSEISASQSFGCGGLRSRRLQIFSKNSGLKVAQINCIRMEIVFCVPQQILLERTNFHLGPKSFYCGKM